MEWISVKDKLPEEGDVTLCYEPRKGNMFTSQFLNSNDGWQEEWYDKSATSDGCKGGFGHWAFITHWIELPEPPQ